MKAPLRNLSVNKQTNTCSWWNTNGKLGLKLLLPLLLKVCDSCINSFCQGHFQFLKFRSLRTSDPSLSEQRCSLENILLQRESGVGREAKWICFCHNSLITPNGLTICSGFSLVPWQVDILEATNWKAKYRSVFRNVQKKISYCTKLVVLSSQSFESNFLSLTKFCPGLFMGQRRKMLMKITDVAKPPWH